MLSRKVVLLRGVTPNGKSKIPDMTYLAQILEDAGFRKVKIYLQTGNVILETELSNEETIDLVHKTIYDRIGADICPVVKNLSELKRALEENPFQEGYDRNFVKLFFTNDAVDKVFADSLSQELSDEDRFFLGSCCLYIYNPPKEGKKTLNNSFFERRLRILATSRKLAVIEKLSSM